MTDAERLDWLEAQMRPQTGYVEVYLAGLRNGDAPATGFQVELQDGAAVSGPSLREAIDAAARIKAKEEAYYAANPDKRPGLYPDDPGSVGGI